ncbi:hypothetical protein ANRL1_00576 [Anaerolineae bacterium]|nr:hypothetical protein ANRL1_00576 [Anaerolineae bacterium]
MHKKIFMRRIQRKWLRATAIALTMLLTILFLNTLIGEHRAQAAPPAQSPIVVNAVDNDPNNKLWNCETNRILFGNEEVDRSRCFSFHYQVPREGIKSAAVHISLSTLGADQDTDATIVAVGKPYAPCEWGQGKMPGCVGLHGGFQGAHKSLNLNLLDIACDRSVQASPEAQRLVLEQLRTGTLHMLLQDDTAVYSAQLVLNGGTSSFQCGASTSAAPITTRAPAGGVTPPASGNITLEQILPELNQWLTGTTAPQPPDQIGAVIATIIGAVLFSLLALSNYLLSNPSFVQRFFRAKASESTADAPPTASTIQAASGGGTGTSQPLDQPLSRPTTFPEQISSGMASASADASSPASGQTSYQGIASGSAGASPSLPTEPGELLNALNEQAIESLPDAKDAVADELVGQIGEVEKRRRVEEEKKRLAKIVAAKTRAYQDAGNALKQVIDGGGDFAAAQRAWQQAGAELQTAQNDLTQLLKEFPDKPA